MTMTTNPSSPLSAPVGVEGLVRLLERIRDLLASLPVDCLGSGTGANGQPYPIRDEVIHGITKALAQQQTTGITATELGYALKRATPAQVIEYLEDDVNMRVALSIYFEEQQAKAMVERIAALLYEEATGDPWTVAGVEHPEPDRDYYRRLARKIAALVTTYQEPTT